MGTASQSIPQRMSLSRARPFGDDLAPPRAAYFATIPAILVLVGMLSWGMSDDLGFVLACFVGTAVSLYTLWGWLFRKDPTRLSTIMALALMLGYGGGALNTWATLPRGSLSVTAAFGLQQGVLARAIGAVLMSAALLYCLGEIFEKPIFGRDFRFSIDERTRTLIYVGVVAMVGGYVTHILIIGGVSATGGHLNPFGAFLSWLYSPLTAISVVAFLTAPRGRHKVLGGLAALILLMMFALIGRRGDVYTAVEVLFLLGLSAYQWRGGRFRKVFVILCLTGVIVVGSLTFMLIRIAGYSLPRSQQTTGKRLESARRLIQKGDAYSLASSTTAQNVQKRTFVLGFLASILEGSSQKTPALGTDAVKQIELAIPSFLYPNKDRNFSEEGLVDQKFGDSFTDEANSVLTAGATDFGLTGMLLYPLLMVLVARIIYDLIAKYLKAVPLLLVALSLIFAFLQTETTLTGYFEDLRVSFFFGLLIAGFMAFPRFKLRAGRV